MCEGFGDFKSLMVSKVARIEDVYEGIDDFWTILKFLAGVEGSKPAREYFTPQRQPQPAYRESLYRESGKNLFLIPYMEAEADAEE